MEKNPGRVKVKLISSLYFAKEGETEVFNWKKFKISAGFLTRKSILT